MFDRKAVFQVTLEGSFLFPLQNMTFLTILAANLVGTFLANFLLFWIIGKKAEAVQKKQQEIAQELYEEAIKEYTKEYKARVKRAEDYIKMES